MDKNLSLQRLLAQLWKEGRLKKQPFKSDYVNGLLDAAFRNFQAAEATLHTFEEVSFKTAYEGLLQISRALLSIHDIRPDNMEQHKTTFLVAQCILGEEFQRLIDRIQKYRIKRNDAVYEPRAHITAIEAENIIKTAHEYWNIVKKHLEDKDPNLKLFEF